MRLIEDAVLAAVTIMQEAAGEPYEGKVAVGEVIRRRAKRHFQSDGTIAGTVLRSYAFSGWNTEPDFLRIRTVQADSEEEVVRQCLSAWADSATSNIVPEAVSYCRLDVLARPPAWANPGLFVKKVGHHSFYRSR